MADAIDYIEDLPKVLQNTGEFKALGKTVDKNIGTLWDNLEVLFDNQFLATLNEYACRRWETIMGLGHTGTLEDRRQKILARANEILPYDTNALKRIIAARIGNSNFTININYSAYKVTIMLHKYNRHYTDTAESVCENVVPANMLYEADVNWNDHSFLAGFTHDYLARYSHEELRYF